MDIGIVGLGRMGGNMARRLARGALRAVGHDPDPAVASALHADGGLGGAPSLATLIDVLPAPRIVRLMVTAGAITESTIGTKP